MAPATPSKKNKVVQRGKDVYLLFLGKNALTKEELMMEVALAAMEFAVPVSFDPRNFALFTNIFHFSVSVKCGTTIAENNTYFESGGSETGGCSVTVCPCSDNICQV